jgi:hypothetical protein
LKSSFRPQSPRIVLLAALVASLPVVGLRPSSQRAVAAPSVTLSVDAGAGRHAINPDIYGINFAPEALARRISLPVDRWGGDTTETYNWKLGSANHGINWYFSNFADCWEERFDYCQSGHDFRAYRERVEIDDGVGAKTILTLPMLGWVAKDAVKDQDVSCSYPSNVYDPQDDHDPYHRACGNGQRGGRWITDPAVDPNRAGTPITPEFSKEWIADLVGRYGNAASGGVEIYALGNEPGLWHETHHDFHPDPLTYDELWEKSRALAVAVKEADPTADVLGPAEWGWLAYFCSAADRAAEDVCNESSPDRAQHGGTPIAQWYLEQFKSYDEANGKRLLDYFDLHYYPAATYDGGRYRPVTDVTRPLWDPGYKDPSWIDAVIKLIPRMHDWVDTSYPGTKLAITEYNMGLDVTKNKRLQTLIQADTLGIFGREQVDLATFWPMPSSPTPAEAFALYRNYDGNHSTFGDVAVRSTSSAQGKLAVYAAQHGDDGALTIVVVNKTPKELGGRLSLSGFAPAEKASVFRYAGSGIDSLKKRKVSPAGFTATYPGRSATLFVLPPATRD